MAVSKGPALMSYNKGALWAVLRSLLATAGAVIALIASHPANAKSVLFVGNSFTFGALSPVLHYRPATVTDLNGSGVGGVPALFKQFTEEAGLSWQVSLETSPGIDLQWHLDHKKEVIDRPFDHVVLQSLSILDARRPGDPTALINSTRDLVALLRARNPTIDIWLDATWSRPDQTYQPTGHWYGKPIDAMEKDIRSGCDAAVAANPAVHGVLPVGQAFNRAIESGLATANPYNGTGPNQIDLWAWDNYHASSFGYYLEAIIAFGAITGREPLSLGPHELAAAELGISPTEASALQRVAHDQLAAEQLQQRAKIPPHAQR